MITMRSNRLLDCDNHLKDRKYFCDLFTYLLSWQQWVDLARFTGLQMRKDAVPTNQISDSPDSSLECQISEATITIDEVLSRSGEK